MKAKVLLLSLFLSYVLVGCGAGNNNNQPAYYPNPGYASSQSVGCGNMPMYPTGYSPGYGYGGYGNGGYGCPSGAYGSPYGNGYGYGYGYGYGGGYGSPYGYTYGYPYGYPYGYYGYGH